jgi:short-subunit dehydrogenase
MANVKISDLTAASAAAAANEFEINEAGTSKKVTGTQISTFVRGNIVTADLSDTSVTAAELNYLSGVTSDVQTQINNAGGGLFKGENGQVGSSAGDIFRINEQTLNTNTTIDADENANATGPLAIASGVTLTVTSGGNLSIV